MNEKNLIKLLKFMFHPCFTGLALSLTFEWYQSLVLIFFGASILIMALDY